MVNQATQDLTIGVITPSIADANLTKQLLGRAKINCRTYRDADLLVREPINHFGTLLVAEEILRDQKSLHGLRDFLADQPPWSDLPVVVILGRDEPAYLEHLVSVLGELTNITFLIRPVRLSTFISIIQADLRARARQLEIRHLLEDLTGAKANAEAANRAKSAFLANMSHEIRTPLAAILGFTDLLEDAESSLEDRRSYLSVIQRNGQILERLINDILDLSKVEADRLEVESLQVNPIEIAEEVVELLKSTTKENKLNLLIQYDEDVPVSIRSDPTRLRQILINIIGNAIKYTEAGSIEVKISFSGQTDLEHRPTIAFTITDTGIGLNTEQRQRIFHTFSQADNTTTRRFGGTGLGLTLSRLLARALGGDVELISSEVGVGSSFLVTICTDLEVAEQEPQSVHSSQKSSTSETSNKNYFAHSSDEMLRQAKILIADDKEDNRRLLKIMLKNVVGQLETVSDGEQAVAASQKGHFDFALIDIQMPKLDGFGTLKALRSNRFPGAIIALTAHAMLEDRQRCLDAGFDEHVSKPIAKEQLITLLKSFATGSNSQNL